MNCSLTKEQRQYNRTKIVFFIKWYWNNWTSTCKKKKKEKKRSLDTDLKSFIKINPKWIIGLNEKSKNIKLLGVNIGDYFDDLGYGNDFLDSTPKAQSTKEIIEKLDFIKIINVCSVKDTVKKKWEEKPQTGKSISKTHIWKRTVIQNIQRTLKIKNKKTMSQIKKWAKDQNRDLIKEKYLDGK